MGRQKAAEPVAIDVAKPLEVQVGGAHYKDMPVQPIELAMSASLDPCEDDVIKYVSRYPVKGGVPDLEKAAHYVELSLQFIEDGVNTVTATDYNMLNGLSYLQSMVVVHTLNAAAARQLGEVQAQREHLELARDAIRDLIAFEQAKL